MVKVSLLINKSVINELSKLLKLLIFSSHLIGFSLFLLVI